MRSNHRRLSKVRSVRLGFGALLVVTYALLVFGGSCRNLDPDVTYPAVVRAAPLPATFVVYGDNRQLIVGEALPLPKLGRRASSDEERLAITNRIVELHPAFVVNSGDLVWSGADDAAWRRFDREHVRLRERGIPYYPALGNHEYVGRNERCLENFFRRFPHLGGRRWYELTYGPLRLLILDSNFSQLSAELKSAQMAWLKDRLRQAEGDPAVRAVFLVAHHPPYTNCKVHGPDETMLRHVDPLARTCSKYRGMFAGHVHSYERFLVDGIHYIISGGGGAPLVEVETDPARWRTRPAFEGPAWRRYNIVEMTLTEKGLAGRVHELQEDLTWRILDTFEIPF